MRQYKFIICLIIAIRISSSTRRNDEPDGHRQRGSTILFLDVRLNHHAIPGCRPLPGAVAESALIIAEKLADGVEHLAHMNHRTTRDKLLSYLSAEARRQRSCTFTVPFNRQQLADYLGVQRAAMCAELSRMQKDGLLEYHRNRFTFLTVDQLL